MGAALTYARRYSLFSLVGIAEEDDLDAPDLDTQTTSTPQVPASKRKPGNGHAQVQRPAPLDVQSSARTSEDLVEKIKMLSDFDTAAEFAKRILPIKNTLVPDHALNVEQALETKMKEFSFSVGTVVANGSHLAQEAPPMSETRVGETFATPDRSTLMIGHAPRRRNKAHLQYVASQPCIICGRCPSDPHHLKFAQPAAMGRKVSDEFTVPLCRTHHREAHRAGKETDWWSKAGGHADPLKAAADLWAKSQALPSRVALAEAPP
jgi:hypothetical protein